MTSTSPGPGEYTVPSYWSQKGAEGGRAGGTPGAPPARRRLGGGGGGSSLGPAGPGGWGPPPEDRASTAQKCSTPGPGEYDSHKAKDFALMGLRKTSRDAAHRATTRGGLPPQAFVRTQSLSSKMTANLDWRDKFVPTEVSEAPQGSPKKKVFNMRATSGAGKYSLEVPFVRQINYSQTLTPSQLHRPAVSLPPVPSYEPQLRLLEQKFGTGRVWRDLPAGPAEGEEDDLGVPSGAAATLGDPSKEGESRRMACNLANASEEAARRHALWSERSHTHLRSSLDSRLGKSPKRVVSQQAA